LSRVPLERYDEAAGIWSTWPDVYRWEELSEPRLSPELADVVQSIGLTQAGADDPGQYYE